MRPMASTIHTDERGVPDGDMSAGSMRIPSEFEDDKAPADEQAPTHEMAQEGGDAKFTPSPAGTIEQDDGIVYPEGITFILILCSLLLCTFLMALDQVWRRVPTALPFSF